MRFDKLKRLVDPSRPITYGIVQAGPEYDDGIPYIRPADMTDEAGVKDFASIKRTSPEIAQQYRRSSVATGDLVVSIGPSFGKVMEVPVQLNGANLTQGTARVAPGGNLNTRFAFWCLRSGHCYAQWEASIGGATFRALNLGPLAETRIPLPDLPTQRTIADFLDRETARIDTLIEKKQRLVELLGEKFKEQKRNLFCADVRENNERSSLSYLKRVNAEWRISKNSRHFKVRMGETILSESVTDEGMYPVYSATESDVFFGYVNKTTALLNNGDLVVPARGNSIGHVKYVSQKSTSTQTTIQLKLIDKAISSNFAYSWMKAFKQYLFPFDRTAIPQITTEQVGRNPIPLAPFEVQNRIAMAFQQLEAAEQQLLNPIQKSIDRLKEYRSALITSAVTGQIDVTNWTNAGTTDRQLDAIEEEFGA